MSLASRHSKNNFTSTNFGPGVVADEAKLAIVFIGRVIIVVVIVMGETKSTQLSLQNNFL